MAIIKIRTFGGELPSASARALPPDAARTSLNLLASTSEFRPLAGPRVYANSPVNNPKTIRRFFRTAAGVADLVDLTASWAANAEFLSLARGQIDDDKTERTYFTVEAGGAIVFDNTGFSKMLGVPAPAKPSVSHAVVNEYTVDEDSRARARIPQQMLDAVIASGSEIRIGAAPTPTVSGVTAGWLSHEDAVAAGIAVTQVAGDFAFLAPMQGGAMLLPEHAYLLDTAFGGRNVTYLGNPYWAVGVGVQGIGYTVDGPALTALFKAIATPDPDVVRVVGPDFDSPTQQYTNAQIADAVATVAGAYSQDDPALAPSIRQLAAARLEAEQALSNYNNKTVATVTVGAFYSKVDVAAEIAKAIANFANSIVNSENSILSVQNNWGGI